MSLQPGWYPDHNGLPVEREWDGERWTGVERPRRESVASTIGNGLVSPADRSLWKSLTSTVGGRILGYLVLPLVAIVGFLYVAGEALA